MDKHNMLDWHFPRDELAKAYIRQLEVGITNSITLFAERRRGKTEFLLRDVLPHAEAAGFRVVYASMWAARQDPALALCAALKESIKPNTLRERITDIFNSPVKSIELEAELFSLLKTKSQIEFDDSASNQPTTLLAIPELLDHLIQRAKPGNNRKVLLMLDEIQFLAKPQFDDFVAGLRTALDLRRENVKVIFTGSSRVRLQRMFESIKAPLFQSSQSSEFPNLGIEFVKFMAALFRKACKRKLDIDQAMAGFQRLSYSPGLFRDALDVALLSMEDDFLKVCSRIADDSERKAGYDQIWSSLKEIDQTILALVIDKQPLYTKESGKIIAKAIGIKGTVSATQIQNRVNILVHDQILLSKGRGHYEIENSNFETWIKRMMAGEFQ